MPPPPEREQSRKLERAVHTHWRRQRFFRAVRSKTYIRSNGVRRRLLRHIARLVFLCLSVMFVANGDGEHLWEALTRFLPRTHLELQRRFLVDWRYALKRASEQEKYHVTDYNVNVFIISLDRVSERKRELVHSLEEQRVRWTTHHATDGLENLDMNLVKKYAGYKKQKLLGVTASMGYTQLVSLKREFDHLKHVSRQMRISLHERLRFGCYMSHVLLWQKIVQTRAPFAVVFEDDAMIGTNFSRELKARLERLPANWDILFLNGCYKKFGYVFDDGLRQSRGGLCTFAYVISVKGARYLLHHSVLLSNKPIDHVLDYETLTGHLLSFHADPPLAHVSSSKASTLAY